MIKPASLNPGCTTSFRHQRSKIILPRRASHTLKFAATATNNINSSSTSDEDIDKLSEEYTKTMSARMGAVLTYRHEDGMNYNRILDDLIVGSCLQQEADVDKLVFTENVRTVLCLQEDSDMEYFSLDLTPIKKRCAERQDISHLRHAIRDFDPFSLRRRLPGAVAMLHRQSQASGGTSYIHCTAGLGRAPATALAYMWWVKQMPLDDAHSHLTSIRPCSPKLEAIRAATVDLLYGGGLTPVRIALRRRGDAQTVRVAGLDVGWGQSLEMQEDELKRLVLERHLPAGKYQFKFIMDDRWTYSVDHCHQQDGDNINNFIVVPDRDDGREVAAARERLRSPGGKMTREEHEQIMEILKNIQGGGTSAPSSP